MKNLTAYNCFKAFSLGLNQTKKQLITKLGTPLGLLYMRKHEIILNCSSETMLSKGPVVFAARASMIKLNALAPQYSNACEIIPYESPNRTASSTNQTDEDDESHDYDFLIVKKNEDVLNTFKVYPNPNTGSFFVNIENLNASNVIVKVSLPTD